MRLQILGRKTLFWNGRRESAKLLLYERALMAGIRLDLKAPSSRSEVPSLEEEQQERWQDESAIWAFVDGSEEYIPSAATADIWKGLNRYAPAFSVIEGDLNKIVVNQTSLPYSTHCWLPCQNVPPKNSCLGSWLRSWATPT